MQTKALAAALAVATTLCFMSSADSNPQALAPALDFHTVVPCRAVDTRAGAPLASGVTRTFQIGGACGVPGTARALVANVTVAGPTASGFLRLWPADRPEPATSTITFDTATLRSSSTVETLAVDGSGELSARAFLADAGSVHLIVDVTGYLAGDPPGPLPPCTCPVDGVPFLVIFGVSPISVSAGTVASIFGQSFPPNVQMLFGDAATGSSARIVSISSTTVYAKVPAPPPSFTFSTEPCDSNADGLLDGRRDIPTPINVNAQSLDGTGCVATLINAFTLMPPDTTCTSGGKHPFGVESARTQIETAAAVAAGEPVTQCECPTHGAPPPQLLGIAPSGGNIGTTVTISGQDFAPLTQVWFGGARTGSAALILSSSSTSITARVSTPPPNFRFSVEPCDGNGDGIPAGTRNVPTPISVSLRSLDGTECVATLDGAFLLTPTNTTCTGDISVPPVPR